MSHNLNKVNDQEPNRAGAITQALNDLSDLSAGSPTSDQGVAWSGSAWAPYTAKPNEAASAFGIDTATGGFGTSVWYDQSYEDADGFYINLRYRFGTPSYLMTLNNTSYATSLLKVFAVNSQWWKGFQLTSGYKYRLEADLVIPADSGAGAYAKLQWRTAAGTSLGPIGFIRRPSDNRTKLIGFIDLTSSSGTTDVGLYNHGLSGNVAWIQAGDDNRQTVITARIME